jgi:hypothetical protein
LLGVLINLLKILMKKSIFFLFIFFLFACQRKENEVIHYFDQYTMDNTLYGRNRLLIKIIANDKYENKIIVEGQPGKYWFYEDFYEKYSEDKGLYRKFKGCFNLCYRFDSLRSIQSLKYPTTSLFLYNNIILIDKKTYNIKGNKYKIYAYSEYNGSDGIDSYYLDKFGFFAYDLNNGYYLLCNRSSEYEYFSEEMLKILSDSLVRDTHFFSMYRFNKNKPHFKD